VLVWHLPPGGVKGLGGHEVHDEDVDEREDDLERQVGAGLRQVEGFHGVPGDRTEVNEENRNNPTHQQFKCSRLKVAISRGKVITEKLELHISASCARAADITCRHHRGEHQEQHTEEKHRRVVVHFGGFVSWKKMM
jgi:hypothetical protein